MRTHRKGDVVKPPKKVIQRRRVLMYPAHWFRPEDLLSFIELRPFTRRWHELGLTDVELGMLQIFLMTNPRNGDVIEGTGGLRKCRFSMATRNEGKRGGLRICYVYIEEVSIIVLALVYSKAEKDDLRVKDKKNVQTLVTRVVDRLKKQTLKSSSRSGVPKTSIPRSES